MHSALPLQENIAAWEEERKASKYADGLEQLPATRKIPMKPEEVRLPVSLTRCQCARSMRSQST